MKLPAQAPDYLQLLYVIVGDSTRATEFLSRVLALEEKFLEYRHWDKLRRIEPTPEGLSREAWWCALKQRRLATARKLPLIGTNGIPAWFSTPPEMLDKLQRIERRLSADRFEFADSAMTDEGGRDFFNMKALFDESISSSMIEGAATTREAAHALLASGKLPQDKADRMIVNNYRTVRFVRKNAAHPLTPEFLLEIHSLITQGTLDKPDQEGRFRNDADAPVTLRHGDGTVVFAPPAANEVPERVRLMCDFANAENYGPHFIHPILRAILLHFWSAYDHPFNDGNGRTARALFYWSMLNSKYPFVEYISISEVILREPTDYYRAFQCVETDFNDTTYFILHQLEVIEASIVALRTHIEKKRADLRENVRLLEKLPNLNHRQVQLLSHGLKNPGVEFTVRFHSRQQGVTLLTARTDLENLSAAGFLLRRRIGRAIGYIAPADLEKRMIEAGRKKTARK